jgi:hypothetical protein
MTLTLPLDYSYLDLDLRATEEGLNFDDSTRFQLIVDSVFCKKDERNERDAEHRSDYLDNTLIDRTKCSANNFLNVVVCRNNVTETKVMKLNER